MSVPWSGFASEFTCWHLPLHERVTGMQCLPGTCTESQYGLKLASKAAVPSSVIQHAVLLANRMRKQEALCMPHNEASARQSMLLEKLHELLIKRVQNKNGTGENGCCTEALWQEVVQCAKQGVK